jgi:hypothetical protein
MRRLFLLAVFVAQAACATIPESPGGNDNLPNASAGPFRTITTPELGNLHVAPKALEDDEHATRDGSIVDLDGDPSTTEVYGYFAGGPRGAVPTDPPTEILRYGALDGRSFNDAAQPVLRASEPWEGGTIGAPDAVRVDGGIWLYYAARGGVGLAKSDDGKSFTREGSGPVLAGATNPGVVRLDDGSFRMFFEVKTDAGPAIDEAASPDGVHWTTRKSGHALAPASGGYDARGAGSPAPMLATSETGRAILRVYYTATDAKGAVTIGLAARFGDDGPLDRAVSPVFGTANSLGPHQPSVVAFKDFTLLFATQDSSSTSKAPAIACGVAPGDVTLPPPRPR